MLQNVESLRTAIAGATAAYENRDTQVKAAELAFPDSEREALLAKRDALRKEVAEKNVKVKILIDELRELHRDIVVLLASYKSMKPQTRAR